MAALSEISILFPGGDKETFNLSLAEIARRLQGANMKPADQPLLVIDEASGLKLYYLHHTFGQFASGFLDYSKLKAASWCHGLYRNITRLKTQGNDEVEPESLWLQRHNELILINDDLYITCDFNVSEKLFRKIG